MLIPAKYVMLPLLVNIVLKTLILCELFCKIACNGKIDVASQFLLAPLRNASVC